MRTDPVKWTLRAFFALLSLTIVYLGWDAVHLLAQPDTPPPRVSRATGSTAPGTDAAPRLAPRSEYQPIVHRNLFGTTRQAAENPLGIDLEALEKTKLDLKLWGTVFDAHGTTYAVIETRQGQGQTLYRVGEYIENARIRLILRHRIVLSVAGRDEVLELHESLQTAGMSPERRLSPERGPDPSQLIAVNPELLAAFLAQPENLGQQAQLEAADLESGGTGVRLTKLENGSVLQKLGLAQGDVIESAQGVPVSAPEDVAGLLEDLTAAGETTVSVQRRGQTLSIRYVLRDPDMYPGDN